MRRTREARYRRAKHLVCYWQGSRFIVRNYAAGTSAVLDPVLLEVLAASSRWTTPEAVTRRFPGTDRKLVASALDALAAHAVLVRAGTPLTKRERALDGWRDWVPDAAFFHLASRDVKFTRPAVADAELGAKALREPPPPPLKTYPRASVVSLPAGSRDSPLARVLLSRRTWRRFGAPPITASQLGTLLDLTWGVQHWMQPGDRSTRTPLKTAPSGGARHSIEAYVLIRRVSGLRPGLYHYDPNGHRLHRLKSRRGVPDIADYVPHQTWYRPAAALVLMTAVFARAQWRYPYSAAYRSVLYEAGHHCQTFLLLATALGLAPFCTGALADSRIEADLGIDGVSEAVIYACGVGARPRGVDWAPWPDPASTPTLHPPRSRTRRMAFRS